MQHHKTPTKEPTMPLLSKHVRQQLDDLRVKLEAMHHNVPPAYLIELIDIMTGHEPESKPAKESMKGE